MTKIQDRLDKLRPYVIGIRYVEGYQMVDVVLNDGWKVLTSEIIRIEPADKSKNYYMFFSDDKAIDIDDLLDFVEEIIKFNLEREAKHALLKEKFEELKKLFKSNTLERLENLIFTFGSTELEPSLNDIDEMGLNMNIDDDNTPTNEKSEVENIDTNKEVEVSVVNETMYDNVKKNVPTVHNDIELPPKNVELQEFKEPQIKCECGPDDVCPLCAEEKGY